MVLISTANASNSATIDFTGLNSTYTKYIIEVIDLVPQTNSAVVNMRVGTGATPTYQSGASDYRWHYSYFGSTASALQLAKSNSDSKISMLPAGTDTGDLFQATIQISNPSQSTGKHIIRFNGDAHYNVTPEEDGWQGGGAYNSSTAVTAIRIYMSSGNIASGIFKLYGLL